MWCKSAVLYWNVSNTSAGQAASHRSVGIGAILAPGTRPNVVAVPASPAIRHPPTSPLAPAVAAARVRIASERVIVVVGHLTTFLCREVSNHDIRSRRDAAWGPGGRSTPHEVAKWM